MRENRIENNLIREVEKRKGVCIKIVPCHFNGFPDRMIILPFIPIFFVELKKPGKTPRPLQLWVHRQLKELGVKIFVIDTIEKINIILDEVCTS